MINYEIYVYRSVIGIGPNAGIEIWGGATWKNIFLFFLIRVQWNDDELNETCKTNQNQSMEISGNVAAIDLI